MRSRVRRFAHVLERTGLAMAGAAAGLFVAALVGSSIAALTTQGFLLIMMIAGGALLPLLWGRLIDLFPDTPQYAYWICVPCYLVILYYSLWGYKVGLQGRHVD